MKTSNFIRIREVVFRLEDISEFHYSNRLWINLKDGTAIDFEYAKDEFEALCLKVECVSLECIKDK
jgi:hypothetical protein